MKNKSLNQQHNALQKRSSLAIIITVALLPGLTSAVQFRCAADGTPRQMAARMGEAVSAFVDDNGQSHDPTMLAKSHAKGQDTAKNNK